MAILKIKLQKSATKPGEGKIVYRISQGRESRRIKTGYHLFVKEWDERRSMVLPATSPEREPIINEIRHLMRFDFERIYRIIRRVETENPCCSINEIFSELQHYESSYNLRAFMTSIITRMKSNGKDRTAETYRGTLRCFSTFLADHASALNFSDPDRFMLDCLTPEIIEDFEAWQQKRGIVPNTISYYNRILRAVYNRAVRMGIIENRLPFRNVYTGVAKTVKRAIPLTAIRHLRNLKLSRRPSLDYARDMFMMSFYLRGMSFIDMAFLKKTDLSHGVLTYRRQKTGQTLVIAWTAEMQSIVDKYRPNPTEYLLPIITHPARNDRNVYRNKAYHINCSLKVIANILNIKIPLTLYVARHSWASAAKAKNIPVNVISEGLGHDSETTTKIYLASLDSTVIDRANAMIIRSL